MVIEQGGIVLCSSCSEAALHGGGNVVGSGTALAAGLSGIKVGGGSEEHVHPFCARHVNAFIVSCDVCAFAGEHLVGSVVRHEGHLAAEGGTAIGISHIAGTNLVVGHESYLQVELVGTLGLVVCHEHLVGG